MYDGEYIRMFYKTETPKSLCIKTEWKHRSPWNTAFSNASVDGHFMTIPSRTFKIIWGINLEYGKFALKIETSELHFSFFHPFPKNSGFSFVSLISATFYVSKFSVYFSISLRILK
jgi:hypothetical protein